MTHWIWLPKADYPDMQACPICGHSIAKPIPYRVAEFKKYYSFAQEVREVSLKVCGDTYYRLFLNDTAIGDGPVCAGGDFLCTEKPPAYFAQPLTLPVCGKTLTLRALVQLGPTALCDYSMGHGGFWLEGEVRFSDGTSQPIGTDSSWLCRQAAHYTDFGTYNARVPEMSLQPAEELADIWHPKISEIPPMDEYTVFPKNIRQITVQPGETLTACADFNKIYASFICLRIKGKAHITADRYELPELWQNGDSETVISDGDTVYRSLRYYSIGTLCLTIRNDDVVPVTVEPYLTAVNYPVKNEGDCHTSDRELNAVYDVCKWTLRICRQTIHLDSPRHQEPLACTGDYYIESLMTACTFGDMRLAEFDLYRTARWLEENNGVMFHTSYSLQWIMMLWDVYRFTGNIGLLQKCLCALLKLLSRFESYIGDNGLLEKCPNYMFVDWNTVDGFSMHHPPKYLGQSCLCMQYHGALQTAANIFNELKDFNMEKRCLENASALRTAIRTLLYDSERGLYFDGLPTPDAVPVYNYLPENLPRRHFSKHSNVMAVLYGVCSKKDSARILRTVLNDTDMPDMQPYFMHFTLSAIRKTGLQEEYLMPLLERWKPLAANCGKGLQEGWFPPDGNGDYLFDFSHAWGGTPAYQLPVSLLGLEIVEPGWRTIRLNPRLYGLEYADISIPTPYGFIYCHMERNCEPIISVPPQIKVLTTAVSAITCTA